LAYLPLERVSRYGTELWGRDDRRAAHRTIPARGGQHREHGPVVRDHPDPHAHYPAVGLDRRAAIRAARRNPHNHDTRRWMGEKIMTFLADQGMVTRSARPIYRLVHLI
jgi:hypothetical protein